VWTTDLAPAEDGQRTKISAQTFEWWYFDTIMDDGSTCVATFLDTIPFVGSQALQPILQLNISRPDGTYQQFQAPFPPEAYAAASDRCDVRIGPNRVKSWGGSYHLHAEGDGMKADLTFEAGVPGWRLGPVLTPDEAGGQWLGEQVVLASGTVTGTLTYDGKSHDVRGTCYHDHQWGGGKVGTAASAVTPVMWYWGRASAGEYSMWFAQVFVREGTGPTEPLVAPCMLAHDGRMSLDTNSPATVTLTAGSKELAVVWPSPQGSVTLILASPTEIASFNDAKYLRYVADAHLTVDQQGVRTERRGKGIWEINHFI